MSYVEHRLNGQQDMTEQNQYFLHLLPDPLRPFGLNFTVLLTLLLNAFTGIRYFKHGFSMLCIWLVLNNMNSNSGFVIRYNESKKNIYGINLTHPT